MNHHHANREPLTLPSSRVDGLAAVGGVTCGLPVADACARPRASRFEIGRFVP